MGLPGPGKDLPCDTGQHIHNFDTNGLLRKYSECEGSLFARLKSCLKLKKKILLVNRKFVKSWIYKKGLNFGRFTGSKVVKNVQKLNSGIDSCFEFEYSLKGIFDRDFTSWS